MIIKKWWFKNYKSYGNIKHTIDLTEGQLILLSGENGSGKSSLLSSLDLALFNEELNKQGKRLPKSNFVNRRNASDLEVGVEFETDSNIHVTRTMSNKNAPVKTTLVIDGIPYDKAGKLDQKIIEKIGFDFKTFKSFISMNVNNFKNFISLTPEEKRLLLDKLFNLDKINSLNKILKELHKENKIKFNSLQNEIKLYNNNINDLNNTIKKVVENKNSNKKARISEITQILKTHKKQVLTLEAKRADIEEDINIFESGISKLNLKNNNIIRDINDIKEKIDLYKGGKCPTCHTDLTHDLEILPGLEIELKKVKDVRSNIENKLNAARIELKKYKTNFNATNTNIQNILNNVISLKSELKLLSKKEDGVDINAFKENVKKLVIKRNKTENTYQEVEQLKIAYEILLPIWSDNGIKQNIIESIVDPINAFIEKDLAELNLGFIVELDSNFDAHIYEFNEEINVETLSTGEAKKINLIIMLAYIKMLRMSRNINVLFLDEVFSSIDIASIEDILKLFKKFANERKINIFLVHHSELKHWYFDKIITVEKTIYSNLDVKTITQ
jgi:DNA repair exonuclease SbcCD ATPase subunit